MSNDTPRGKAGAALWGLVLEGEQRLANASDALQRAKGMLKAADLGDTIGFAWTQAEDDKVLEACKWLATAEPQVTRVGECVRAADAIGRAMHCLHSLDSLEEP